MSLIIHLRSSKTIDKAWKKVRSSARNSLNSDTRKEADRFDQDYPRHLRRIIRQIRENRYHFKPATGLPIHKPGKSPRPIVRAHIEDRIVQRALLDTVQKQTEVQIFFNHRGTFGGLPNKQIGEAIREVCTEIRGGATYVIGSDIQGFFKCIKRKESLAELFTRLPDDSINTLLTDATEVELDNLVELESKGLAKFFPDEDTGVAQGSALSSLLGNVYLYDFDEMMNQDGIRCIRWVDDFLILAPNHSLAWSAFEKAKRYLTDRGMSVYDPRENREKATAGPTSVPFDFLGCSISDKRVLPSRESKKRILGRVRDELINSAHQLNIDKFDGIGSYNQSLIKSLSNVSYRLRAWTNAYAFCDEQGLRDLDEAIDKLLSKFIGTYADKRARNSDSEYRRRLLGVWLVRDRTSSVKKIYPIEPKPDLPF